MAARGPLTEEGIAIIQETMGGRRIAKGHRVTHHLEGRRWGNTPFGTVWLQPEGRAVKDGKGTTAPPDIKAIGGAITYAKRYGLELALGIGREDVDSVDSSPNAPRRASRDARLDRPTTATATQPQAISQPRRHPPAQDTTAPQMPNGRQREKAKGWLETLNSDSPGILAMGDNGIR